MSLEASINSLSIRSSSLDSVFNSRVKSNGLAKKIMAANISELQMDFIYAVYLQDGNSFNKLAKYLTNLLRKQADCDKVISNSNKIAIGALLALIQNKVSLRQCVKCDGAGCSACNYTGSVMLNYKEYELCDVAKSTWYKYKSMKSEFDNAIDHLLDIQEQVRITINNLQ